MAKPAILAVDDDVAVVGAVVRDLRQRYGEDYRVLRATSGPEALEILADQVLKDRPIAAVVSDQRMPGMTGIEVLQQVREQSPDSKLLLLTAYADTDVAIRAINDIALDYYLMKPWDPPEERLYPVLDELLRDWAHGHPDRDSEVRGRRPPLVRPDPRGQDVPHPQPRALPLARGRPDRRGGAAARGRRRGRAPGGGPPRRVGAALPHHDRARRRARPEHPRDPAALRPLRRGRRAGRPRGRGVRRLRGAAGRRRGARRAGRPGRAERVDRELPRLPQGPLRRRSHPPRGRAGVAVRSRDGAGARRRRLRDPRSRARRAARRLGRHRGPRCPGGQRGVVPPSRRPRARRLRRPRHLLRRQRERGDADAPARTCTSSARPTRPGRPCSTSPSTPPRSCSSCAAPRWRRPCRSTS